MRSRDSYPQTPTPLLVEVVFLFETRITFTLPAEVKFPAKPLLDQDFFFFDGVTIYYILSISSYLGIEKCGNEVFAHIGSLQ